MKFGLKILEAFICNEWQNPRCGAGSTANHWFLAIKPAKHNLMPDSSLKKDRHHPSCESGWVESLNPMPAWVSFGEI
jgi:hypothetical protein